MAQSADSTRLCEICIGGPGEHYCQQCDQLFCRNCKLSHLRAKISKKHTFLSGQNINKEEKLLCPEHEESFLFCCHDCDTPVCRFCSVEKHSRHLMTDLTKTAEKQKNELLKIIKSKATTSSSYMGKIKKDANIFREKNKAVIKTITEQGNYCKKLIDKKVHSFVKLVQDEEQKTLQSMSTDTKVYLGILEKCQQLQNNIKEMETTPDVILLKKLKHIKTGVDQIVLRQSPDTSIHSVSYTNKNLSDTDIDNLFGEFGCPYSSACSDVGRSDTEKENLCLRAELTEALKNIEKRRQEYSVLSEKYETGMIATERTIESLQREKDSLEQEKHDFRAKLDQIQSDLNHYKNEQVHEQDSSHGKIDNLLQQNRKLEYDRELLREKIFSLKNDKIKLEELCRQKDGLLQNVDSNAQKMKKDHQELQTQMISQKQNYDTLKNKLESFKDKNIELEDRLRQSEAAGNKLRDYNPNIADLSDINRPTSLAEKFSSLYTDEYTNAMKVIEDDMHEAASVKVMLDWLKKCYEWCQRLAKEQRETLINRSIGFMENHGGQKVVLSDRCLIFVKEFQKKIAVESLAVVGQICHVKSVTQQTLSTENYIVKYIKKCSELCWMMQISDPPLYVNFDVNSGENLNKNDYNMFTKSGSKIDYLVWPVLYLHKTGPMLAKGVAQGK